VGNDLEARKSLRRLWLRGMGAAQPGIQEGVNAQEEIGAFLFSVN
jgi:hypothetical protein